MRRGRKTQRVQAPYLSWRSLMRSQYMSSRYLDGKTAVLSYCKRQMLVQVGLENALCCRASVGTSFGGRNPDGPAKVQCCATGAGSPRSPSGVWFDVTNL